MKFFKKIFVLFFIGTVAFLAATLPVKAESSSPIVESAYTDIYRIVDEETVLVSRTITLTNLTGAVYVSEYRLSFNNAANIENLSIQEDNVPARAATQQTERGTLEVTIQLSRPAVGRGSSKIITIAYALKDFITREGVLRELFIPVNGSSTSERLTSYRIEVRAPSDYPTLGVSKPPVTTPTAGVYVWSDVTARQKSNLYIAFSPKAYYEIELNYAFSNNAFYPKKLMIPFVPEGAFQKIYVESINPPPEETVLDEDGNYLGVYRVPPNSAQKVVFKGIVELSTEMREEVQNYNAQTTTAKKLVRYLTREEYWNIEESGINTAEFETVYDVYRFVVDTLSYDTERINTQLKREGALWAVRNPQNAVCMEYTDLFIALGREKGIPSREVVGYAVTSDETLLPKSFFGDILHAWPEYYDKARQIWVPVDPTWEDTARVDYFSSFDLNHLSLVYHGQDTTVPLPPGVYKLDNNNSKNVFVQSIENVPRTERRLSIDLPNNLSFRSGQKRTIDIMLQSESNTFLYDLIFTVSDKKTGKALGKAHIDILEPFGKRQLSVSLTPPTAPLSAKSTAVFSVNNAIIGEKNYTNQTTVLYIISAYKGVIIAIFTVAVSFVMMRIWR